MWRARTLLHSVRDSLQWSCHGLTRHGSIFRSTDLARQIARFSSAQSARHEVRAAHEASLQQIFDNPSYWKSYVQKVPVSKKNHGLIGNPFLTSARGFKPLAERTQQGCQRIVEQVVAARTQDEYRRIPRQLDLLSDALCRVLDLAEFIRLSHPDPAFQQAAVDAYAILWEYMNVLNTTPELKSQLERALSEPDIASRWTNEEKCVADILLKDFSKSAIDLPDEDRQRFIKLSNDVKILGSNFLHNTRPASSAVRLSPAQLKGLNHAIREDLPTKNDGSGMAYLPLAADLPYTALSQLQDEDARKTVYISSKCVQQSQLNTLAQLLTTRQELAQMSDFGSHAEMNLTDKMAKTPDAVHSFLLALTKDNKPYVQDEIVTLRQAKSADLGSGAKTDLQVWDTAYYQDHLNQAEPPPKSKLSWLWSQPNESLRDYFSLGRVMQGLSRLFDRLYGVRFVPRPPVPGELWDRRVRRLDVLDQHDRHIAVLYCDLFSRVGKSPNPAHFTLRCSRRITPEERLILYPDLGMLDVAEKERDESGRGGKGGTDGGSHQASTSGVISASDTAPPERLETNGSDETTALDDAGVDDVYQLPVIALVCDFPDPSQPSAGSDLEEPPTLLSLREVQTLFHEMGHAIHSILARTSLQVISGTRCATDFAEIPSVLMESFAVDPAVLNLFAQHWSTGMPLLRSRISADQDTIDTNTPGAKMLEEALRHQRSGHGLATETQVLYSLLDQAYHHPQRYSGDATAPTAITADDTTRLFYAVYGQYASIAEPPGLSPQGLFGHLVEYGGTYYSYLFDRAVAGKIWRDVFHSGSSGSSKTQDLGGSSSYDGNGALDRAAGLKFKREMLRWGGARDPWECLAGVLRSDDSGSGNGDCERLRKGGQEAMEEVGRWGVHVD